MGNIAIFTDSLSTLQALNSADPEQMIHGLHSSLAKLTAQFSVSHQWVPAHVGLTGNEQADRLAKIGSQAPQTQKPITYREAKTLFHSRYNGDWKKDNGGYQAHLDPIWRLERAHRPRPSVLPKICWETSANMAAGCWSGDQAVGLGKRPLPDGWFCGINRTEDLTCTAVDRWRRRSTCARHSGRLVLHISRSPPGLPPLTDPVQHLPWMNDRCPWKTPWHSQRWWSGHHKPLVRWHWWAGRRRTRTCGISWSSSPWGFLRVLRFPPLLQRLKVQPIK